MCQVISQVISSSKPDLSVCLSVRTTLLPVRLLLSDAEPTESSIYPKDASPVSTLSYFVVRIRMYLSLRGHGPVNNAYYLEHVKPFYDGDDGGDDDDDRSIGLNLWVC